MNMTYKEVLPGVNLRVIESSAFEASAISVQFLTRLDENLSSKTTLIPRVLRRGTVKHPDMEALAAALDDMYGARIEPLARKYGDLQTSGFICDFVDPENNVLHSTFKLLGEILFEPKLCDGVFLDDYVDGERSNLIDEIKSEINNKLSYAHKKATEIMFRGSSYALDELGSEESAEKIDSHSLYKHYKSLVSGAPCEVFFCGNHPFEEIEREVRAMFKLCPRGKLCEQVLGTPVYCDFVRHTERFDIVQANLLVGMHNADSDVYASKLLASVLGGGTSSKLFTNVREKKSLCYFTGAMYDSFERSMFMYCGIDPKNAEIAENAMLEEFNNCLAGDITDEEIENAKKGMIDDILTVEDSLFSMESFWTRATLLGDERSPSAIAKYINALDGEKLSDVAAGFKMSVTYLLTGMEEKENAGKLLPEA